MKESVIKDITLTAREGNWRLFMTRKADKAFLSFSEKVFRRDQYCCQFCGMQSLSYMDVINADNNYLNNKLSNLKTACPFCAQCCFLDAVGRSDFGGGVLIFLPEMTQSELNGFCHYLFASVASGNEFSKKAKELYRSFKLRVQIVDEVLGKGLSSPSNYGQMLIDAESDSSSCLHEKIIESIRLLPNLKLFSPNELLWSQEAMQELYEV
jgi:intracellular multiplication protein IcmJ